MELRFDNQVALITGGGKGIGLAIATAFARSGASLVIADVDLAQAEQAAQTIRALGQPCLAVQADVADDAACGAMVASAIAHFGRLDIVINNAGISKPTPSLDMPAELWHRIIGINLSGVFFSSQAAARHMARHGGGVIISIASIAAAVGFPGRAPYCAAKAGVVALTQTLGSEWASANIRVNAVAPGYVMTELVERNIASGAVDAAAVEHRTPLGRLGTPDDVANAVLMLAAAQSSFTTGTTLYVDGGWTAYGGW